MGAARSGSNGEKRSLHKSTPIRETLRWRLGAGSAGRIEERRAVERLGAANRGATRNIARGPLFHPLKENWQDARPDESGRETETERGSVAERARGGLAGYNGTKLL